MSASNAGSRQPAARPRPRKSPPSSAPSEEEWGSRHEIHFQITAGLRFRPEDAPWLWRLDARHWPTDVDGDVSSFAEAAQAAENGTVLVVQVMKREELDEIVAWFPKHGVMPPAIEDLRLGHRPEKPKGKLIVVER